jgi:hypothetical protein
VCAGTGFLREGTFWLQGELPLKEKTWAVPMESSSFLPKCPKCGAWPMAVSEVEDGYRNRVKFTCGRCATVSNATIGRTTIQQQTENSLAR